MDFLARHTAAKYFMAGLWCDEAFSWAMASQGMQAVPLTARDFNPPLYYLLLYGWMQLFGASEAALRSLSMLFFAGTLAVVWRFMRDLLDVPGRRAAAYLVLFGLNPVLCYFALEARMYSLLAFLAALSFYAFHAGRPWLYVLATTAGLYTHYFMVLAVVTQLAAWLLAIRESRRLVPIATAVLLFVPWVAFSAARTTADGTFWALAPGWRFAVHLPLSLYTGHDPTFGWLERGERWLFTGILAPLTAWGAVHVLRQPREQRPLFLLVALWAALPPALVFATALVLKPLFVPRYLIFSSVGLLLLLVLVLERARPVVRYALLGLLCALAVHYQALQAARHTKGPSYREALRPVAEQAGPRDLLLVSNALDFFPAQYYFDPDRVYVFGEQYDRIPRYLGRVLIPRSRVVDQVPGRPARVFLLQNAEEIRELPVDHAGKAASFAAPASGAFAAATAGHVSGR